MYLSHYDGVWHVNADSNFLLPVTLRRFKMDGLRLIAVRGKPFLELLSVLPAKMYQLVICQFHINM